MLLDIILSRGTDFNAKCQIRCRWLGGLFMLIRWLIFWWYVYMKPECVLISQRRFVCVCLPPHRDRDGAPRGEPTHQLACVGSTGAPCCFTAGSNTKEQQECLWTPQSPRTCGLTWLSPVCNSTVGKVLLLLEGFERLWVCACASRACMCVFRHW